MKAPFPWFGGKRRVAPEVWSAFGDVDHYVEPFAGSLAVLLERPSWHRGGAETVNDADRHVANFWRAIVAAPEDVAHHADWPVNETDLFARHMWLVSEGRRRLERMEADPDFFDAKVAGWWPTGRRPSCCAPCSSEPCSWQRGPPVRSTDRRPPPAAEAARGGREGGAVSERPIIFGAEMVRAILAGTKTQTRRVVKPGPQCERCLRDAAPHNGSAAVLSDGRPYLRVGFCEERDVSGERNRSPWWKCDELWVRETWCPVDDEQFGGEKWIDYRATPRYSAEAPAGWHEVERGYRELVWRSPIHMPRSASRITLRVTDVRVERLQEISGADAVAEGMTPQPSDCERCQHNLCSHHQPPVGQFRTLWDEINGKRHPWDSNPWVWVVSFEKSRVVSFDGVEP